MKSTNPAPSGAQSVLNKSKGEIALIMGNGINLSAMDSKGVSWSDLMIKLIEQATKECNKRENVRQSLHRLLERDENKNKAASLPEVFDIITATGQLDRGSPSGGERRDDLQIILSKLLQDMRPGNAHRAVVQWAQKAKVPVLTTNYDHCLQDAFNEGGLERKLFRPGIAQSDFYPWDRYYSPGIVEDPLHAFAIWHIHGDQTLRRSIRAGLDHYMGMVERLRKLKSKISREALAEADTAQQDAAEPAFFAAPWLRVFMSKKLWIQGLGLHPDEVSLRWLLIERYRYWKLYRPQHRGPLGWYVHGPTSVKDVGPLDNSRRWFFESVGLKVLEIQHPEEMYVTLFGTP